MTESLPLGRERLAAARAIMAEMLQRIAAAGFRCDLRPGPLAGSEPQLLISLGNGIELSVMTDVDVVLLFEVLRLDDGVAGSRLVGQKMTLDDVVKKVQELNS